MTWGWFLFGVVAPAIVIVLALLVVRSHDRRLRERRQGAGDVFGSNLPDQAFDGVFEQPRSGMTVAERVAELERTLAALIAGGSGWPDGLIDPAVKRLEAQIEVLSATDQELHELSAQYQAIAPQHLGTTSAAIVCELARRSTLSSHERMAEAAARARMREC